MPEPILLTSKSNPRFKQMRVAISASGTKRTHTVLLGEKLILDWLETKAATAENRLSPLRWLRLEGHGAHVAEKSLSLETWEISENLMKDISDCPSPPSLALVMELAHEPTGPLQDWVVVPWGIQDPGNLGAILRSAAAFGFQEAILGPECADPFSPKALRGAMGAAFALSVRRFKNEHFADGRWVALCNGAGATPVESVEMSAPLRLMIGNEGHGWRDTVLPATCVMAAIPTLGVESLNAAVAAGIACFEADRRRKSNRVIV